MQPVTTARRFYARATAGPAPPGHGPGFAVLLDGRLLRTPARAAMVVATQALATALAAEWEAQVDHILPATMPLTRLVNVALDHAGRTRPGLVDEVCRHVGGDLTCYRAPAPAGLVARQRQLWDPVHDWIEASTGVRPLVTSGLEALAQPAALEAAVRRQAEALDDLRLTVLASVTGLAGSAFLALGLVAGGLDGEAVFRAIRIEEDWQADRWGADAEEEARAAVRRADLLAAATVIAALAA